MTMYAGDECYDDDATSGLAGDWVMREDVPDEAYRRLRARDRARHRVERRVAAVLDWIATHPGDTRASSARLRRLDDLLGEADALRKEL